MPDSESQLGSIILLYLSIRQHRSQLQCRLAHAARDGPPPSSVSMAAMLPEMRGWSSFQIYVNFRAPHTQEQQELLPATVLNSLERSKTTASRQQ